MVLRSDTPPRAETSWNSSNTTTSRLPLDEASLSGMSRASAVSATVGPPLTKSTASSPSGVTARRSLVLLRRSHADIANLSTPPRQATADLLTICSRSLSADVMPYKSMKANTSPFGFLLASSHMSDVLPMRLCEYSMTLMPDLSSRSMFASSSSLPTKSSPVTLEP